MMSDAVTGREIVTALGGKWYGGQGRCPCPIHGGMAFTVVQKGEKVLFTCWGQCPRNGIIGALRDRGLWRGRPDDDGRLSAEDLAAMRSRREAAQEREREEADARADDAARMWHNRLPIAGTLAETYLRQRGINGALPPSLGFSPGLRHSPTGWVFPTLLAAVMAGDRRITGIQRIFLDQGTAGKALVTPNKMTFGILGDGAVRLAKAGRVLGIAEGIETALSARKIYSLPVWAALGAGRIGSIALPDEVQEVILFADRGAVGELAAEKAADRYNAKGYSAHVMLPDEGYGDFNNALLGEKTAP